MTKRPEYGSPEWNAIYDAGRKALGYPSREELAAFNARFPVYGTPEWHAKREREGTAK